MDLWRVWCGLLVTGLCFSAGFAAEEPVDYGRDIAPLLTKYCAGCHNDRDREGKFSLETYSSLQAGIEGSPTIIPGDAQVSKLWRAVSGQSEDKMPPEGEPVPAAEELERIKVWIDQGAAGPSGAAPDRLKLSFPHIEPHTSVSPVTSLAFSPDNRTLAIGRFAEVTLLRGQPPVGGGTSDETWKPIARISDVPGKVEAVHFTPDSRRLVSASGIAGSGGLATLWDAETGKKIRDFPGHRDILFDAKISPDGNVLATCSYDRQIILWNLNTGEQLRTLSGHNGAVYDVAFSPDGKLLASASADDTCKVWRVRDGERLDTLSQPLKEVYAVAFSPDGKHVLATGADNRIRIWQLVSREKPEINPQVLVRFAHEAPVVRMTFTPDGSKLVTIAEDRTIKVWDARDYSELKLIEHQPDVVMALAISPDSRRFAVGRLNGSWESMLLPTNSASASVDSEKSDGKVIFPDSTSASEVTESEPNDLPDLAQRIALPALVRGAIDGQDRDADCFRFSAYANEEWVIEVNAARSNSGLDSFVQILTPEGRPVEQTLLQAVSESYFTFRGKDGNQSDDFRLFNWEEMELNELLYANGEVVKLWLYPRGPDSGFLVYPGTGKRWNYFGTSGLTHALGEPCYVVRPHRPGTELIPNGLPIFPIYYENDDGIRGDTGVDSKLFFTAPETGDYVIRLRDVRGEQGPHFTYSVAVRPSHPDFEVRLSKRKIPVDAGSGANVEFTIDRKDEFDGPVTIDVTNLPPGFQINTPLTIESHQISADAALTVAADAKRPTAEQLAAIQIVATAQIRGQSMSHPVAGFESIPLGKHPTLTAVIRPAEGGAQPLNTTDQDPLEFEIHPGETIMLKVIVDRMKFKEVVSFGKTDAARNLPHGVYIDNIGLNGLMLLPEQTEREFFITATKWVPAQTRMFHLRTTVAGGQASKPVILHVRPRQETAATPIP